jgi:hypothetical protein
VRCVSGMRPGKNVKSGEAVANFSRELELVGLARMGNGVPYFEVTAQTF